MPERQALAGVRCVDLTGELGVYATKLMADLGADVIRVEPPGRDALRAKPPLWRRPDGSTESLFYAYMNTSKRAVSLDPTQPAGRALLLRLLATAQVVVESDPPGVLGRAGITYDDLQALNPAVVHTLITPFGEDGPWADYHGPDLVLMATGGLMWLAGEPDGPPLVAAGEQANIMASLNAAAATLVALLHAEATGEGQQVSVSAQECVAASLENAIQFYDLERTVRRRRGARPQEAGTGLYPCRDGYVYMMAGRLSTPRGWRAIVEWLNEAGVPGAEVLTRPEWSEYAFRATPEASEHFWRVFTAFAATRTKAELYEEGQRRGIIIAPVNDLSDLPRDPQLLYRSYFVPVAHPELGDPILYPGPPYRLSATPWRIRWYAPLPGEHNDEVYGELGLGAAELADLRKAGVI